MRTVFAQSAISYAANTIPIVSVRTVRNWEEITFRIVLVLYVESSGVTTTRTVFVPSVATGDSDQFLRAQKRCGKKNRVPSLFGHGAPQELAVPNILTLVIPEIPALPATAEKYRSLPVLWSVNRWVEGGGRWECYVDFPLALLLTCIRKRRPPCLKNSVLSSP